MDYEKTVYLSVKIKNKPLADEVESQLKEKGIIALNPCSIVLDNIPTPDQPPFVADTCYSMINQSAATVVVMGANPLAINRDCAVELGYTKGSHKPIFFYYTNRHSLAGFWYTRFDAFRAAGIFIHEDNVFSDIGSLAQAIKSRT